ncbi:MAG: hypothetical protein K2H15_02525 [Muribaculaceae bacterium]|nr:hypothetical protein [Muribaculaceae bacterium]
MKKTETIALYKEAFLAGKDEETRRRFEEKDVEKQYGSIIAWRRRQKKSQSEQEETDVMTPAAIIDCLKKIKKNIPDLPTLGQTEAEKLLSLTGEIADDVRNFERIKKSQLLSRLESEQQEIDRQRNSLQERINNLRNELNWQ